MNILERYIFRQLLGPFGFFVLILAGVVWLTQSLRVIDMVVNNGQSARVFLELTMLLFPVVFAIVIPLSALAATVYALHQMLSDSELIAAFACGASKLRVARPVAAFGLCVTALLAFNTLYLMPTSARIMRDRVAEVRGDVAASMIRDGRFLHPADGLTVFIREITSQGELKGVFVQDARDAERPVDYMAKSGFLTRQSQTPTLVMFEGQAQRLEDETARVSTLRFETFAYDLSKFITSGGARNRKPSERYFWSLINPDPQVARTQKARGKFISEGHEQLSAPLYALALPLLAAAALFGATYSRRGFNTAIGLALALGAVVRVLGLVAKSAVAGAPFLWPLMYAAPLGAIIGALWWLTRTPKPAQNAPNLAEDEEAPLDLMVEDAQASPAPGAADEKLPSNVHPMRL